MENEWGRRLDLAMRARGITKLSVLAAMLGVTESAVCRWRRNGSLTMENAVRLCDLLDIAADWFLLGRGHMDMHKSANLDESRRLDQLLSQMSPRFRDSLMAFVNTLMDFA